MKTTLKTLVFGIALPALLAGAAYFGWSTVKASVARKAEDAQKPVTIQVEYAFSSNGLMVGSVASPLEITQVTRNNAAVPLGGVFKSDIDLLSGATIRVKNNSKEKISVGRIAIDWIDPQEGRTFATMCGLEINGLAGGAELVGKVTTVGPEKMRQAFAAAGRTQQRLLVRIDTIELANDTMWQYGVMHRKDPNSPDGWTQISQLNPVEKDRGNARMHNASYKTENNVSPTSTFVICAYWRGASAATPTYCASCGCYIYNDAYSFSPQPNGFGRFGFDYIPQGCGGHTWLECPGCQKRTIVSYSC